MSAEERLDVVDKKTMIDREEASCILTELSDSGILDGELCCKLDEIRKCIEAEYELGVFLWGADMDWIDLYTSRINPYNSSAPYNTDKMKEEYDEWTKRQEEVYEKYKIREVTHGDVDLDI